MPSRLKGIETFLKAYLVDDISRFGYAFPFEGNWNSHRSGKTCEGPHTLWICVPVWRELKLAPFRENLWASLHPLDMRSRLKGIETRVVTQVTWEGEDFGYAFPFEGNWNKSRTSSRVTGCSALDMPSRLKGIETNRALLRGSQGAPLWICLPVWRELKPIATRLRKAFWLSLDMPSRLKGIETVDFVFHVEFWVVFVYAFPFEGNWNPVCFWMRGGDVGGLWICVPVWRELKLHLIRLRGLPIHSLYMRSRLKGIETLRRIPFGILANSLYMRSRLKGIETIWPKLFNS